eukprot:jgi/Mesen1/4566/ME000232S03821
MGILGCTTNICRAAVAPRFFRPSSQKDFIGAHQRWASTLVVAEHDNKVLKPATLNALAAAAKFEGPVTMLVAGSGIAGVVESARKLTGVSEVLAVESKELEHELAEPLAELLIDVQERRSFSHIVAPSSTFGRNLLPRAAALLDVAPVSDVTHIIDDDTFVRPIYAGNAMCTVKCSGPSPRMMTVRTTAFQAAEQDPQSPREPAPVSSLDFPPSELRSDALQAAAQAVGQALWVGQELRVSDRPELGSAKTVVAGGRGLKSAENFRLLDELADKLGAAVGASRAAVDAGYVPNDLQVGQTGKVVAPDLYIAVGISGAIQHLAGMKDSRTIVAINKDPDAPIFQVADYGLEADLFKAVPELIEKLPSRP